MSGDGVHGVVSVIEAMERLSHPSLIIKMRSISE